MRCSKCDNPAIVKKNGKSSGFCIDCKKEYGRRHYEENKASYVTRAKSRNREVKVLNRSIITEAKSRPCADCGNRFPTYVMDFDHIRGKKKGNIGSCGGGWATSTLRKEIEKCDVVCANCHRERTYQRHIRRSSNGRASASKTEDVGSIPTRRVEVP